jgi:hypothetical protein
MTIHNITLSSTALAGATYDTEMEELTITFVSGGSYTYNDVPEDIFEGLKNAGSPGRYWHAFIKDQY